jgi:RNA polymerase sigma-70 factor (ECF subfamily)
MLGEAFDSVLEGARRADEHAYTRLYTDLHPALLRYLRGMAYELAEDAASETWLEVARSLDSFHGPEPAFRGWVFAIARRKLIDRIRYETRRPTATWDDLDAIAPLERDAADLVIEADSTQNALALVRTLPRDQAEAVLLRVLGDLDYAEIAVIMDRSSGAVRVLVHRGLRRLEELLADRTEGAVTP